MFKDSGLKETKDKYKKLIDAVYDEGKKTGKTDYDKADELRAEYMKEVDKEIKPIIDAAGGVKILNKSEVINALSDVIGGNIPRDDWTTGIRVSKKGKVYQDHLSTKVYKFAGPDLKEILQERWK